MKKLSLLFCLLLSVFVYAQNPADISHNFGVYPGFENGVIGSLAKQTDGKILAGGIITSYRGVTEKYIIRLNTDGTIDATFNTGSGFNNTVSAITLQPDGKIPAGMP